MRKVLSLSLSLIAILSVLAASFVTQAYSQQSEGVFVGRGRVAHREVSRDRDADRKAPTSDELKPMMTGRVPREIYSLEQQCFEEVNRQREAKGLARLELSKELLAVARNYSQRMAEENFFSHIDPEGRSVRQRVSEAGIKWRVVGENLAYSNGYTNPVAASMHGWMESPGHRRNILDRDYRATAIGAWISSNGTVYFTEIFLQ